MPFIDTPPQDDWVKQTWPYADRELSEWQTVSVEFLLALIRKPVWVLAPDDVRQVVQARLESEIT